MNNKNKYRLTDFFNAHWDKYIQKPTKFIQPEQYKAVNAMRVCRTEALGVNYYACPDCGEVTKTYHSCKNRFCPNCSWKDTLKWAEKIEAKLIKTKHRHIIFFYSTCFKQINNKQQTNKAKPKKKNYNYIIVIFSRDCCNKFLQLVFK